ncbi:MAG: DUF423 domain-containing protein [Bacteroidota bacterium]|nr:DUF423 domain-containing protein [Bacteroidota bacterium]MDP3144334.1 DUF423 domain-containing protein [Bacteroidota bacterium]MDP3556320.1 DUF423 domain-containing protein [Bacteroidota bacterium]
MRQENLKIPNQLITIGVLGAIAVSLGAIGAHALKGKLQTGLITPDQLNGFDTGVKYQIYHTIAMLLVVLLKTKFNSKFFSWAYNLFFIGIILFSGSLYFLCTRNLYGADWLKFLGPITPIGGLLFVAGWICLALSAIKKT